MRNPDQLPSVLHALLAHPALSRLLNSPVALMTYLRHQAWPEQETDLDPLWEMSPDSQEASEAAEILPLVEEQLAKLTDQQQEALSKALVAVCPACQPMVETLMLLPSNART